MTAPGENAIANVMYEVSPALKVNVWLSGEGDAERLAGVMGAVREWLAKDAKARELLVEKPQLAVVPKAASGPPQCPVHATPMKPSTTKAGGWFCSKKVGEGYCTEKVAA